MHEARIEVTTEGADFLVRLIDVDSGEEKARGVTPATALGSGTKR